MKIATFACLLFVCGMMSIGSTDAKKLGSPCFKVLGKTLVEQPTLTARGVMMYKLIRNVDKRDEDIAKSLQTLLEPIADYMFAIKKSSSMIRAILVESLDIPYKDNLDAITLTSGKNITSYILRYLNSDQDDIIDFMKGEVTSKKQLSELYNELDTILTDVKDSLSDKAKESYKRFCEEVKQS